MKDLTELGAAFVAKHGAEKTASIIGKGVGVPKNWLNGNQPTLIDVTKLLQADKPLAMEFGIFDFPPPLDRPMMRSDEGDIMNPNDPNGHPGAPGENGIGIPRTRIEEEPEEANKTSEPPPPVYIWPSGTRVAILMPSNRAPHIGVLKCFSALFERDKMQFIPLKTNMPPSRGRNILAQRWIESGCELGLWWDDDILPPHGDIGWFRHMCGNPNFPQEYANINPIQQLLSRKRTLIGGCYFGRNDEGLGQFSNAFTSRMSNDAAHQGPRNFVEETPWVGFGFTLVSIQVLRDIVKTQPEVEIKDAALINSMGYRYRFFNSLEIDGPRSENSEDVCFCERAKRAGHATFVDHTVQLIHMGDRGYSYHNTRPVQQRVF